MAIIGKIAIRMEGDTRPLEQSTARAAGSLDAVTLAADRARASVAALESAGLAGGTLAGGTGSGSGSGGDAKASGLDAAALGAQIHNSLLIALAPLGTFAAAFGRQFSQVGGTLIETSRRVSDALRVIGGESLQRSFAGRAANAETYKVQVDNKSLRDAQGFTAGLDTTARHLTGTLARVAQAEQKVAIDASAFKSLTDAIAPLSDSLGRVIGQMETLGRSTAAAVAQMAELARGSTPGPQLKVFEPARPAGSDRTTKRDKGNAAGHIAEARAEAAALGLDLSRAGRETAAVAREAGAVDRFFGAVNQTLARQIHLVEQEQAKFKQLGASGSKFWQPAMQRNRKDFSFLSEKSPQKSLAQVSTGGRLNRAVQEVSLLGAQFRTLTGIVTSSTGVVRNFGLGLVSSLGVAGLAQRAGGALVGFFTSSIGAASDLNETLSKTRAVLGDASGGVERFADDMASRFGLVKRETLDAAAGFGGMAKGIGNLSGPALGQFSTAMTKAAADLSSFANVSFARAVEALKTGLSGEQSDELKKLGVVINETAIKSYALAHGFKLAGGKLSENQKFAARAALITQKLADSHKDLDRTQSQAANQGRQLQGTLKNLAASIGTALLPAYTAALKVLNEFAGMLGGAFNASKATFAGWASTLSSGFAFVGKVARNFGTYAKIGFLYAEQGAINLLSWVEVLPQNLALIAEYVSNNWRELIIDAINSVSSVFENLGKNLRNLFTALSNWAHGGGFQFDWTPLLDGFYATAQKLPEMIRPALVDMQGEIDQLLGQVGEAERKRAAARKPDGPDYRLPQLDISPGDGKDKEGRKKQPENVEALELGSKEAASAIAKFRNGNSKADKDIKDVARTTKDQLGEQRRQTQTLERILARTGTAPSAYPI